MNRKILPLLGASAIALGAAASAFAQMPPTPDAKTKAAAYTQTNLVTSGKPLKGKVTDKNLLNAWGLVQGPTPFWVSDNNAGVSTLYDGTGKIVDVAKKTPFVVTIPPPGSSTATAAPTGIVFNSTATDFTGDLFIFATEDGTIAGWQPADNLDAVRHADNSAIPTAATGAVYKGLAIATLNGHQFIYATNFRSGNVDVFDSSYNPVTSLTGTFTDPHPIAGFAPFGITLFGTSNLWVTYAMQDAAKHDPVHQVGAGYIDIFSTEGVFEARFATGGNLNAPWGMVLTPTSFGPLGGDFWIGNFGDGNINAYTINGAGMGTQVGQPKDNKGNPLIVDGLWALVFGNGTNKAATTSLYFTAGPNMESEGIFGTFDVMSKKSHGMVGGPGPYGPMM
ncbi:MAG TPA: TIGR03118 family protein [Candidatus Binatus sp.]|uniref:TIGR03118 family protein n=1 Tax=Candidatus Binatus sp. TaxID=2811406 RepID=UPI002F3E990F